MQQRTPQWEKWRKLGSSDAAACMDCDPYKTKYQLWERKTGRQPDAIFEHGGIVRGRELEPAARAAYEEATGRIMAPATRVHPNYAYMTCSLDGLDFDASVVLEIKILGHVKDGGKDKLWDAQHASEEPLPHFNAQIQHQLACTGADEAHLWVWHPDRGGFLRVVKPDVAYITRLIEAERIFWDYVTTDCPPPQTEKDVQVRHDGPFLTAAAAFIEAETRLTETRALYEGARQALLALSNGGTVEGGGVRVTTFERAGSVDYSKIPELKGVSLDKYRKAPIREHRVTVKK